MGNALQVPTPLNERIVMLARQVASGRRYLSTREVEKAFRDAAPEPA